MNTRSSLRFAFVLTLLLISVAGTILLLKATPEGLLLSDDSVAYVAGARSMLAGNGYRAVWLASNEPVTHFPPGFSSLLTLFGWFGLDPLRGTRFVNAILFGVNAGLLGILIWRMTPSLTAGLVIAGLYITSAELLQVHMAAMSEPLFIFLSLICFWLFDLYFERPPSTVGKGIAGEWWWLLGCGMVAGMAYLTRYAGLALTATFIFALLVLRTNWQKRLTSIVIFLGGFLPFAIGWAIRNNIVAGNSTNRTFIWHPVPYDNIHTGVRVFSEFFIPVETWRMELFKRTGIIETMIVIVLVAVLLWTARQAWIYLVRSPRSPIAHRGDREAREVISFTVGLFILAYLASIFASMTMFDAATKLKLRILAPVFVGLFILLVAFGIWMRNRNRKLVVIATIIAFAFTIYKQSVTFGQVSKGGLGFASFQWYDSEAMAYLRDTPEDIKIYTNQPAAVYLYVERGAYGLPTRTDSATGLERPGFDQSVQNMRNEINAGEAVLALFDVGSASTDDLILMTDGLFVTFKGQEDTIFIGQP